MSLIISKIVFLLLIIATVVFGLKQKTLNEIFDEFKELKHNLLDDDEVREYFGR